jgi:hypothetical protein
MKALSPKLGGLLLPKITHTSENILTGIPDYKISTYQERFLCKKINE